MDKVCLLVYFKINVLEARLDKSMQSSYYV